MDTPALARRRRRSLPIRVFLALAIVLLSQIPQVGFGRPGATRMAEVSADHSVNPNGHTITFCLTLTAKEWQGKLFDVEFNGSWAPGIDTPVDRFTAPKGWQWEPVPTGGWRAYNPTTPLPLGAQVCFTLPLGLGPVLTHINLTATDAQHRPVLNILSDAVDQALQAGSPTTTDTATPTATVTQPAGNGAGVNQDLGTVRGSGFAFVDGRYVAPPYNFRLVNGGVSLNNAIIAAMPRAGTPERVPAVPRSAYDLVAIGAQRVGEMARRAGTLTAIPKVWHARLAALLRSYPETLRVIDDGGALLVTDRQGRHAGLVLDEIDASMPSRIVASQRAMAIAWRDTLATGGVLLFGAGGSAIIGQPENTSFLHGLLAAFAAPALTRRAMMVTLVGDDALARAMLIAGPPPAALRQRLASLETAGGAAGSAAAGHLSRTVPGTVTAAGSVVPLGRTTGVSDSPSRVPAKSIRGHHPSHTPRTRFAYIFSSFIWKDDAPVIRAVSLHGYTVIFHSYQGCNPGGDTLSNLIDASGKAGILYIEAHGSPTTIAIESHCSRAEALDAATVYLKRGTFTADEISLVYANCLSVTYTLGCDWFLSITPLGVQRYWHDANTIVELRSCSTYSFAASFNAREFIAPPSTALYFDTSNDTLWDRIAGTADEGEKRNVGDAFAASDLPKQGYHLFSREHGWTVLSPAVASVEPRSSTTVSVGSVVHQQITFDTPIGAANPYVADIFKIRQGLMVDAIAADNSCNARVDPRASHWVNDRVYEVVWTPYRAGSVRFYLGANLFFSNDNDALLDGNQQPAGTDHVGPNGDPYIYPMSCVDSPGTTGLSPLSVESTGAMTITWTLEPIVTVSPTWTPIAPIRRTNTPTSTQTATSTPTSTQTATPSATVVEDHFTSPYTYTPTPTATATATTIPILVVTATSTPTVTPPAASGLPGAEVSPGGVDFGSQAIGATSQPQLVTITSTGRAPLQITGLTLRGPQGSAFRVQNVDCPLMLAPTTRCGLQLFFTPDQPGLSSALLTLSDTSPDSPQHVVLQGVGTGGSPPVTTGGFVLTPNPATVSGSFERTAGQSGPPSYQDTFRLTVNAGAISIAQQSTGAVYSGSIDSQGTFSVSNGAEQYSGRLQPNGSCAAVTNTAAGVTYRGQFAASG